MRITVRLLVLHRSMVRMLLLVWAGAQDDWSRQEARTTDNYDILILPR